MSRAVRESHDCDSAVRVRINVQINVRFLAESPHQNESAESKSLSALTLPSDLLKGIDLAERVHPY